MVEAVETLPSGENRGSRGQHLFEQTIVASMQQEYPGGAQDSLCGLHVIDQLETQTMTDTQAVEKSIGFDSSEQRVFLHLWRTYDLFKAIEETCLSKFAVTAQQYNALRILKAAYPNGMQTMQLGQRMISRGPDITRMLDRLESMNFINRARGKENRRAVEAVITQTGLALLETMAIEIVAMHQRQLGHLSPSQQAQLIRLLQLARQPHEDLSCNWFE